MQTQFRSFALIFLATFLIPSPPSIATAWRSPQPRAQQSFTPTKIAFSPTELRDQARKITVRVTSTTNGGSGVLVARRGNTYLVLTNQHVTRRDRQFQIKTADGKKHTATLLPKTNIDPKYDVALLQFTSTSTYQLANLNNDNRAIDRTREIYSAGYPFDSEQLRFSGGAVSQLSDLPLEDGTQIGYALNANEKGIRQGMSGGPILDTNGVVIGINTISVAPLSPSYTYVDGSKPTPKKSAQYQQANWGVPIYNLLTQLNPNILYAYKNLPKVPQQLNPTGYMAKLNQQTRQQTVRIEAGGDSGSGVIIAREGNTYSVLTAKHVVTNRNSKQLFTDIKAITFDQESHQVNLKNITVSTGEDLAVIKFTTSTSLNYPVARLSSVKPRPDDIVFVGGYPGRETINSPLWQWQLNPGTSYGQDLGIYNTRNDRSFNEGYNLVYTNITYGGMSGGPVFDTEGRVIGLHGKAEEGETPPALMLGNSLGISIKSFISMTNELKVNRQSLNISKNSPRYLNTTELKTVTDIQDSFPKPDSDEDGTQWIKYGGKLNRIKQYSQAIAAFDRAIVIDPKTYLATGSYGKARAYTGLGLLDLKSALYAGKDYKLDNFNRALTAYSTAITNIPISEQRQNYFLWKKKAGCLSLLKKYDQALREIQRAIDLNPTDITLYLNQAQYYYEKGDFKQAISVYDRLILQQPRNATLYKERGSVKDELAASQKRIKDRTKQIAGYKAAVLDFDTALKLDPELTSSYFYRVVTKVKLGDHRGALADINLAISYTPKNAVYYSVRSSLKYLLKDFRGGIDDCNMAISLGYKDAYIYVVRGDGKEGLKDYSGAIADYSQAIAINPRSYLAYASRGNLKRQLKDYQGGITDFTQAIAIDPKSNDAYNSRATIKSQLKDYQGAITDYTQSIAIEPNSDTTYVLRANAKVELKDYQGAITDYTQSIALNPRNQYHYNRRGLLKSRLKDHQGAMADYTQSIAINPKDNNTYALRGGTKLQLKDYQGAIADFTQSIALNPKIDNTYTLRGGAKFQLKDYQGAIADYTQSIALNPKNDSVYNIRGIARFQLKDYRGAISDFTQAIALNSKNDSAYTERGNAKVKLDDYSGAIADYDQAIALNPKSSDLYNNRGVYKFLNNSNQSAIADWEQAIVLNPTNSYPYVLRGLYQVIVGNDRAGLIDIQQAIQLNPQVADAYAIRGFIRSNSGDRSGAISDYRQALKLNPEIIAEWTNDAKQLRRSNNLTAYQKYQLLIQGLTAQR